MPKRIGGAIINLHTIIGASVSETPSCEVNVRPRCRYIYGRRSVLVPRVAPRYAQM